MTYFKVIRYYERSGKKKTIKRGLSEEEAQAHCRDSESSSRTCKFVAGERRTARLGPWIDRYEVDH